MDEVPCDTQLIGGIQFKVLKIVLQKLSVKIEFCVIYFLSFKRNESIESAALRCRDITIIELVDISAVNGFLTTADPIHTS